MARWQWVTVRGPSMVPALRDSDIVLVRHGSTVRPGDVVLARFRDLPERLVVKRAARTHDGGWWLTSDNGFAGGDSDAHGVADVSGRAVLRVRTAGPVWRWSLRRMHAIGRAVT